MKAISLRLLVSTLFLMLTIILVATVAAFADNPDKPKRRPLSCAYYNGRNPYMKKYKFKNDRLINLDAKRYKKKAKARANKKRKVHTESILGFTGIK
jgi:hypothetical protein